MLVNLEFESRSLRRSLGKCGENTSLILGCLVPRSIRFVKGDGARLGRLWRLPYYCHLGSDPKFMPYFSSFTVVS